MFPFPYPGHLPDPGIEPTSPALVGGFFTRYCALFMEKEMANHSSLLAWRIPGTGEPGGLPSMGLHRVGHG